MKGMGIFHGKMQETRGHIEAGNGCARVQYRVGDELRQDELSVCGDG